VKHIALVIGLSFSIVLIPSVNASQNAPIDSVSVTKSEQSLSDYPFGAVVTQSGKLTIKPGLVFTEGGDYAGMRLPYLVSDPKTIFYPRWAVRQGWQGKCVIAIEVLLDGTVGRFQIMHSTGYRVLDDQAVKAVRSWKFHPAVKDGKQIVTCVEIPVFFKLTVE